MSTRVLEFIVARGRFPRRHDVIAGLLRELFRPFARIRESEEREWTDLAGPMASRAVLKHNRRDVFGESRRRFGERAGAGEYDEAGDEQWTDECESLRVHFVLGECGLKSIWQPRPGVRACATARPASTASMASRKSRCMGCARFLPKSA